MRLEAGESISCRSLPNGRLRIEAYRLHLDPEQFVLCWTCNVALVNAHEVSEHMELHHRDQSAHLELSRVGEELVSRSDVTPEQSEASKHLSELASEHAVDISGIAETLDEASENGDRHGA